jgi:hypothetical protein
VCDDYLRYRSNARECTVSTALSDFHNALLWLITDRGQKLHISHGLQCGVQLRKKEVNRATEHEESVGQFNLIGFVDDLSLFAQTLGGVQALLEVSDLRGNPGV